MSWDRLNPAVHKRWLLILAGVTWMAVSFMLAAFAYGWLRVMPLTSAVPLVMGGLLMAALAYRLGFVSLAFKNIKRIRQMSDRACVFAFMQWKSYPLVAVMVTGGALLRHSAFPKPILAVIYLAMGGSLFLSSLHYYPEAWSLF